VTARGHAAFSTSRVSMPKMRCSSTTLLRRSLSFQLACCRDVYPNIQARLPSAAPTMHRIDRTRRELNAYAKPFRTARFASEFHPPKSALGQTIRKKRRSTPAPWNHLRQRGTRMAQYRASPSAATGNSSASGPRKPLPPGLILAFVV
jgi:hypothetical protein